MPAIAPNRPRSNRRRSVKGVLLFKMVSKVRGSGYRFHGWLKISVTFMLVKMLFASAGYFYRARHGEALLKRPPVKPVSDLEAELARLRQENARLRVEKDILKKAAASRGISFGHTVPRSRCGPRPATEVRLG